MNFGVVFYEFLVVLDVAGEELVFGLGLVLEL